jgi:hypothetical protein
VLDARTGRTIHIKDETAQRSGSYSPARNLHRAVPCRIDVCYPFTRKKWRDCAVKRREFTTLLGGAAVAHSVVGKR